MKRNESLISGPIGSALLAFVVPLMLSSLVQQLYVTADAVIVGRIAGKTALAAIDSVHTLLSVSHQFYERPCCRGDHPDFPALWCGEPGRSALLHALSRSLGGGTWDPVRSRRCSADTCAFAIHGRSRRIFMLRPWNIREFISGAFGP